MKILKNALILTAFFFSIPGLLYSVDADRCSGEAGSCEIAAVSYFIQGRTIERILRKKINIAEGRRFTSKKAFDSYIARKEQLLENERVLSTAKIETSVIEVKDGVAYIQVEVYAKDTWNIIAMPYPKYNSNEGLLLSLRMRDYNFLGSMETLAFNLDYKLDTEGVSTFGADTSFSIPFHAFKNDWRWMLGFSLSYGSDDVFSFSEKTSISMDFNFLIPWTFSLYQEYKLNEKGAEDPDRYYITNGVKIDAGIKIIEDFLMTGPVVYSPSISFDFNYNFEDWIDISEFRRGPRLNLDQGISAGTLDWKKNFRDGAKFSLVNNNSYNFYSAVAEGQLYPWIHTVTGDFSWFKEASPFGFSGRLRGTWEFGDIGDSDKGGPIRGILDKRLKGDLAFYYNADFAVKTWIWFMAKWFEMHTSVFFDIAAIRSRPEGIFQDPFYGAGIELIIFPKFARSIYTGFSFGVDVEALLDGAKLKDPAPVTAAAFMLSLGRGFIISALFREISRIGIYLRAWFKIINKITR